MFKQEIITADKGYKIFDEKIKATGEKTLFLVCGNSIHSFALDSYFKDMPERLGITVTRFCDFTPNPTYESVEKGVERFKKSGTELIVAVGGGSAMDVAKCIKLYNNIASSKNFLHQTIVPNNVKLFAVPTTAGTGSEATRYAVIYYEGIKQSVTHESCIPELVLIDSSVLRTLPLYQKKSTMLDAFCHAVESFWSVNSTEESRKYSKEAIRLIMDNMDGYLADREPSGRRMMEAAYLAGKAINITQTTAGHAMCYKLTGLYGIAHGHAAALCVRKLWGWMADNSEKCIDIRGKLYLKTMFGELAEVLGCQNAGSSAEKFNNIFHDLGMEVPWIKDSDFAILKNSVNPERLKNNPVDLSPADIDSLYHEILKR